MPPYPSGDRIVELLEAIGRPVTASTILTCMAKLSNRHENELERTLYDILTAGVRFGYIQRKDGKYFLDPILDDVAVVPETNDMPSTSKGITSPCDTV